MQASLAAPGAAAQLPPASGQAEVVAGDVKMEEAGEESKVGSCMLRLLPCQVLWLSADPTEQSTRPLRLQQGQPSGADWVQVLSPDQRVIACT